MTELDVLKRSTLVKPARKFFLRSAQIRAGSVSATKNPGPRWRGPGVFVKDGIGGENDERMVI